MLRQIILDTETTGLEPKKGHRIIEIGCLEMVNRRLTGEYFHVYINPERDIERGAEEVHGITQQF
jgi:DNA polymerase-3 subunit epsilon